MLLDTGLDLRINITQTSFTGMAKEEKKELSSFPILKIMKCNIMHIFFNLFQFSSIYMHGVNDLQIHFSSFM